MDLVQFLEEKHNNMSEYSLIDNLRDLTNLLSNKDNDFEKGNLSVRYTAIKRESFCEVQKRRHQ